MNAKPFAFALIAAAAAIAMSACSATGSPKAAAPSTAAPATTSTAAPAASSSAAPSPSASAAPVLVLGPDGLGPVKLGQSFDEALRTGLVSGNPGSSTECQLRGRFKASGTVDNAVDFGAVFAGKLGVTTIAAYPGISTPQGVRIGTSFEDMKKAYPSWKDVTGQSDAQARKAGRGLVPVPGNADAVYRIATSDGKVASVTLQFVHQDCYE